MSDDVTFRDGFACPEGLEEFTAHTSAAQANGPLGTIERDGAARHCQGTAVVDWLARSPDGTE